VQIFRRPNAPTRFLEWRVALFFVAAALWMVSLLTGPDWLALLALAPLGAALLLGYLAGRNGAEGEEAEPREMEEP
jgi:hypothetical protein